jgi:hypothetical protein
MRGQIGYYVHHQGDGHRQRALAIAKAAPGSFTLLGTGLAGRTETIPCLDLPNDDPGTGQPANAAAIGDSLHYAPCGVEGIRQRVAMLADWIAREKPALIVVDVSVEIAMLGRLTGTPMVYVRLSGHRGDAPHLDAFRAASAIIAPFHRELDDDDTPPWVRDKTVYLPGLSVAYRGAPAARDIIVVVAGKGGRPLDGNALAAAAAATPDEQWRAIGPVTAPENLPPNLEIAGWVDTADEEIAGARVVIGHAGDGLVSAVMAAGRPFICLPQARPFKEQIVKARRLDALHAAVVLENWPDAAAWPALLRRAQALDTRAILRLHDPDGAAKAAQFLLSLAE